jgi:hypothetical protein
MFGVLFLCGELGRRWNILRGMDALRGQLIGARWGLPLARSIAKEIGGDKTAIRALVRELFGEDIEVRKRAADVARRVTELDGRLLESYADELAGLLETMSVVSRGRGGIWGWWCLGLRIRERNGCGRQGRCRCWLGMRATW